jgi:hypothetical protein
MGKKVSTTTRFFSFSLSLPLTQTFNSSSFYYHFKAQNYFEFDSLSIRFFRIERLLQKCTELSKELEEVSTAINVEEMKPIESVPTRNISVEPLPDNLPDQINQIILHLNNGTSLIHNLISLIFLFLFC